MKNTIRALAIAAFTVIGVFVVIKETRRAAADPQIGFVDVSRVVSESKTAKDAFAAAEQPFEKKKADAQKAIDDFKANEKAPLSNAEMEKRKASVQQLVDGANADLEQAHRQAGVTIDARMAVIAARLANAHGLQMVMSLQSKPVFAAPGTDLTSELIAELDGLTPEIARKRAEAAAAIEYAQKLSREALASETPPQAKK